MIRQKDLLRGLIKMDRPKKQPPQDLIDLTKIGPIMALTYDREQSRHNKKEAESECYGGHYTYECVFNITGYGVGEDHIETFITETTMKNYVEVGGDINDYGFWRVTAEGHALVSDWEKWLKKEEKDIREYIRLKEKFGGRVD